MMNKTNTGIQESMKYDDFSILEANRLINQPHVQELIKSFEDTPDIARTHPILVNENLEIIDGQHRYLAWKELKRPIYYIMEKGLTVTDAIRLNTNQRAWKIEDYARAYAMSGNPHYQQFLELKAEFNIHFRELQTYCEGYEAHQANKRFRAGRMKLMKDKSLIRKRLEMLQDVTELYSGVRRLPSGFALGMLDAFKNPKYNHELFLNKFKLVGEKETGNFSGNRNDWLRVIEHIYNYYTLAEDQIRLF